MWICGLLCILSGLLQVYWPESGPIPQNSKMRDIGGYKQKEWVLTGHTQRSLSWEWARKCSPLAVPGEYPWRRCAVVLRRPRPLDRLLPPATGGNRLAPHRRPGDRVWRECQRGVWLDLLDYNFILNVGREYASVKSRLAYQQVCFCYVTQGMYIHC